MRFKFTLVALNDCIIPKDYHHQISSVFCSILENSSPQYLKWMKGKGFLDEDGKPKRMFVFSNLFIKADRDPKEKIISIPKDTIIEVQMASPFIGKFILNLLMEIFNDTVFKIGHKPHKGRFIVEKVDVLPQPAIKNVMNFITISPVILSEIIVENKKQVRRYFKPSDLGLSEAIRNNLIKKYEIIHNKSVEERRLLFTLDEDYVKARGGYDRISKIVTIYSKKGNNGPHEPLTVKAFSPVFSLAGSIELIQTAYECGIGEKNSMGFGMINLYNS